MHVKDEHIVATPRVVNAVVKTLSRAVLKIFPFGRVDDFHPRSGEIAITLPEHVKPKSVLGLLQRVSDKYFKGLLKFHLNFKGWEGDHDEGRGGRKPRPGRPTLPAPTRGPAPVKVAMAAKPAPPSPKTMQAHIGYRKDQHEGVLADLKRIFGRIAKVELVPSVSKHSEDMYRARVLVSAKRSDVTHELLRKLL